MKKRYYSLFAAAAMLLATSCSQEEEMVQQVGGDLTTFSVVLDGAVSARTAGDGMTVDKLYYEVYQGDKKIYDDVKAIASGKTSVELQLMKGETYQITFWAQNTNSIYNADNLQAIAVDYTTSYANKEAYDAFFNSFSMKANGGEKTIYLYRPFAQLNVGTSTADWETAENLLSLAGKTVAPVSESQVVVKGLANKFNAVTGKAEGSVTATFAKAAITAEEFTATAENKSYVNLAMNYLLVPGEEAPKGLNGTSESVDSQLKTNVDVEVTFWQEGLTDKLFDILVPNAPIQRNYRTNIIGNLLADATKFNVEVVPGWGGEEISESDIYVVDGTYHILTVKGLQYFAQLVNGEKSLARAAEGMNFANNTVVLENDIDLSGIEWTPIGNKKANCFKGIFDGNNKTISNMTVNVEDGAAGLFGWVENMKAIKNVKLENVKVSSNRYAGALIGWLQENGSSRGNPLVENCSVDGAEISVTPDNFTGNYDNGDKAGGLIGYVASDVDIKNCKVNNAIITGYRDLGGLCGMANTNREKNRIVNISGCSVTNTTIAYDSTNGYQTEMPTTFGEIYGRGDANEANNTSENVAVAFEAADAETLAKVLTLGAKNITVVLNADIDLPISSLGQQTGGSGEYKLGGENTENITIDLNEKKLNITTTYWSAIGAKNDNAIFTIKNGSMTSTGNSAGTWNAWDLRFSNCNYVFEGVNFEKAVALDNVGKSTLMKNVTITDTHNTDTYGLWITAEGQTVTLEDCVIDMTPATDGRGIKIDEQYVDAATKAKVTLNVTNVTFKTEEKAAIVVKSAEGAEINASDLNISGVNADQNFAVWVDEDAKNYADKVIVTGAYKVVEGTNNAAISNPTELANATIDNNSTILLGAGEYVVPTTAKGKNVTFIGTGNPEDVKVAVTKVGTGGENCDYGLDGSTVTFEGITITTNSSTYIGYARCNGTYKNCIINGTYTLYGNSTFENCTFNVSGDVYNIWTWGAPTATFTECTFNSDGKAVLLYGQVNTKLTINECVFNDKGGLTDKKAAIEIGNDYNKSYELIVNETTVNGYEINDKGINTGTTLWANKNSMGKDKLNVVVDGVDVY